MTVFYPHPFNKLVYHHSTASSDLCLWCRDVGLASATLPFTVPSSTKQPCILLQRRHIRAKREQSETFPGRFPESQGRNVALTVLHMPDWLDSGLHCTRTPQHQTLHRTPPKTRFALSKTLFFFMTRTLGICIPRFYSQTPTVPHEVIQAN